MIRSITFGSAYYARRFALSLRRPTLTDRLIEMEGSNLDASSPETGRYDLGTIVIQRGCRVRTDAGIRTIERAMLRANAVGTVQEL